MCSHCIIPFWSIAVARWRRVSWLRPTAFVGGWRCATQIVFCSRFCAIRLVAADLLAVYGFRDRRIGFLMRSWEPPDATDAPGRESCQAHARHQRDTVEQGDDELRAAAQLLEPGDADSQHEYRDQCSGRIRPAGFDGC